MENISKNFIEQIIDEDIKSGKYKTEEIYTRFPPEPNGYLHIGHAKAILLNYGIAKKYGGKFNVRFDDTNPVKEDTEFVESIKRDIEWLGVKWDKLFFASDYFDKMYECAIDLIKQGKAYVCDLNEDELKEYRGDYNKEGRPSPYRDRSVDENLKLFEEMKNGKYNDGEKTLRAKIDYNHPDVIMRDTVIYRIQKSYHHNTKDKWCIYPMYDYAHPLEDAIEGITHSICSLEFEIHRPIYDWVLENLKHHFSHLPHQYEFARLDLTNTLMSKRYLRALVEEKRVDGWDDPRMPTLAGLRRRGVTPTSLKNFVTNIGVTKAHSTVDIAMLEHAIRDDLNLTVKTAMVVLDPIKVVITNYDEGKVEYLEGSNNPKNKDLGTRKIPFSKYIYIERDDFSENPPSDYKRLSLGEEVRLFHAYFIKLNEIIKDDLGNVIELHCTYDPETKSGSGFKGRKPKGTIHWVDANNNVKLIVNHYDYLMKTLENGEMIFNEESLKVYDNAIAEEFLKDTESFDRYQFMRNGYYVRDYKGKERNELVFNEIISLKSSI